MSTLKVVIDPLGAEVDIVLVRGWHDGQQHWTYGSGDSSIFWPEKLLPAKTPRARILTFEYDTDLDCFWATKDETGLDSISDDLFDALEDQRSRTETTKRPIIFVAHSIGGLVLENGLVRATNGHHERKELANCVRRVALLGTPYRGDDKTLWAETALKFFALSGTANAPRPEGLAEKLGKFVVLGKEFPALLESRFRMPETRLELACFSEGYPTELGRDSKRIVTMFEAHVPGCPRPQQLDAKHQTMGEFKSKDDPNFRRVARHLTHWARELAKPNTEAADLTIRIVSLFNKVTNCFRHVRIHRYNLSRDFGTSWRKLDLVRLQLNLWGESVGLGFALREARSLESTVLIGDKIPLAEKILGQILHLVENARQVLQKYERNQFSQKSLAMRHSRANSNRVFSSLHQRRRDKGNRLPARLKLQDKAKEKKFSRLIEEISDLVNDLMDIMPTIEVQRRLRSGMNQETDLALLRDAAANQDKLLSNAIKKTIGSSPTYTEELMGEGAKGKMREELVEDAGGHSPALKPASETTVGGRIAEDDQDTDESHGAEDDYPSSEETTHEGPHTYPPTTADMTATARSAVSRNLRLSSHAQNTVDVSTNSTSMDPGGDHQRKESSTDNESIYTSDVPESSSYAQELATSFFEISEPLPDAKCLERIHELLPDLLRGFALRIGAESQDSDHFRIMKVIFGISKETTIRFKEYYLNDKNDAEGLQQGILNDMPLSERLNRWKVDPDMDDPNATSSINDTLPDFDEGDSGGDGDGDESRSNDSQLSMYRNIVTKSTAFQWLIRRVRRETNLTASEASTMQVIATQIRQSLYSQEQNCLISSKRGSPTYSMVFKSDWNPLAFVIEQEYAEEPDDAIEGAIVLVQGLNEDIEAMPCAEYLSRTWPILGEDFVELVRHVVRSEPGSKCSISLFDKTTITAWIEPSGCFALEATGVVETIVEVGEVYGWMTAALRSSPTEIITAITPILVTSAETNGQSFQAYFRQKHSDGFLRSVGQCWQDLFRNPVVVAGFPVRRRQLGQQPGLECSPGTLTALLRTRDMALFCERVFIKGFCTMLVPTKYSDGTVHWHVLFNEDGSRIPFTDPRIRDVVGDFDLRKHLTLSGINSARHIVGWCETARNYAGAKEANYAIGRTGLKKPNSRFALDRVTIPGGKFVSVGFSVAIGKKDKPARASKTSDYHRQLEWVERRYVVFYDFKDRRAWLLDGLSALLHLVRAHVAHRRAKDQEVIFTDDLINEADTPHTGKAAARKFFKNKDNMDLRISEIWNRPVFEYSVEGNADPKLTVKRQQTFEHLVDLVGDIFSILSMLFDIQADTSTADGFGTRVQASLRRHLEGWDFFDVATLEEYVWPKEVSLLDTGLGWVDLMRSISAVTLFGVGFGELVQPGVIVQPKGEDAAHIPAAGGEDGGAGPGLVAAIAANPPVVSTPPCARWPCLPTGKDLLATTTPVIKDIRDSVYRDPEAANQRFWELTTNLHWHIPDKIFEECHCGEEEKLCDRVQVLLPTEFPKIFARGFRSPSEPLPVNGAVIFGHSWKFPLRWSLQAGSVPTEGPVGQQLPEHRPQPQAEERAGHQLEPASDSGLGTSVATSALGNPSSQASINSDSSRTRHVVSRVISKFKRRNIPKE